MEQQHGKIIQNRERINRNSLQDKEQRYTCFATKWPTGPIIINNLISAGKVSLIGSNNKVTSKFSGRILTITPPVISPSNMPCFHAWVFKIENIK